MKIVHNLAFVCLLQCLASCDQAVKLPMTAQVSASTDSVHNQKTNDAGIAKLVFSSADGGQTWQNISEGLPDPLQANDGTGRKASFTDDHGLHLSAGNGIYHSTAKSTAPFWTKASFPENHSSIAPGKNGIFAFNYRSGGLFQQINLKWSAVFPNFKERQLFNVFETERGSLFISSDRGLFRSTNRGQNWKQLPIGGLGKMVESDGVILATNQSGIVRSTDNGETWATAISEGGVGIDIERIDGGFAAITYSTFTKTRRIRTSYDGGATWQAIDAGLPPSLFTSSIVQMGDNFYCGHPDGIYQSSDKGKTWKRILCPMDGKIFQLSVSGKVIYAVLRDSGC